MAQFGKADTGLIKAVAEAEQGQFMDQGLVIGSTITQEFGKMQSAFAKKQANAAKAAKEFEKEFDKSYAMPTGDVPPKMMQILNDELMRHKNIYAQTAGGSTENKVSRAKSQADWKSFLVKFDNMVGNIQNSQASNVRPAGQDATSWQNAASIRNMGENVTFGLTYDTSGAPSPVVAVSKLGAKPEWSRDQQQELTELQGVGDEITTEQQGKLDELLRQKEEYNTDMLEWNKINKMKDYIIDAETGNSVFNQNKYHVYEAHNLPTYGNVDKVDSKAIEIYSDGIVGATTDSHFEKPMTYSTQKNKFKTGLSTEVDTYDEKIHMIFSDFSEDFGEVNIGTEENPEMVSNSFANLFINEMARTTDGEILNSTENTSATNMNDMYTDLNGNPLQIRTTGDDGAEKIVEYGSQAWLALPKEERKEYLDMHLRGYDTSGNHDPDANNEWMIDKFSGFMANVKIEHKEMLKRQHFERQNRYFNDGTNANPVHKNDTQAMSHKRATYNSTILDVAFPENMLTSEKLIDGLKKEGDIAKALKAEFKMHTKVEDQIFDWDFKNDGRLHLKLQLPDEEEPTTYKFDFTGTNAREEYLKLREVLSTAALTGENLDEIPNNVTEWDEIKSRTNIYHPQGPNVFDPSANLPRDNEGDIITQ